MKNNKLNIIVLLTLFLGLVSCVEDGDYSLPNTDQTEPSIAQFANSPFSTVKDQLKQEFNNNNKLVYTFPTPEAPNTDPLAVIEAYVVSSDATGNFYKKLVVQDKVENPTSGFELLLDNTSLSQSFEPGRKVYVVLDGLTVTYDDGERNIDPENEIAGKYTVGQLIDDRVDEVIQPRVEKHVFASTTKADLVPTVIKIEDITGDNINTFVTIEGAQFDSSQLGNTFSGEPNDSFDGLRTFSECESGNSINLQTSTFASFKANLVPQGRGSINFVLTKDFRAENFVAIVNTPTDINFENQRCDPLFEESFEDQPNGSVMIEGWTNYQEDGTQNWNVFSDNYSLGNSARIGSYNSGDSSTIAWLITPQLDLDAQEGEVLNFKTSNSFSDGSNLEVLISTDWDGTEANITSATWVTLPATIVDDSEYYKNWVNSGDIDLSGYTGTAYIAFKYTGSGNSGEDGTYELDDITVKVK
ncbi:DUF5689 domain-containing protein [Tenacibaculum sp.]|uniref:DUF5689 domain-containing protein n=1 Tax=Tenacibaculum sp. TaxID=1906242 RepID=UPI003AA91F2D